MTTPIDEDDAIQLIDAVNAVINAYRRINVSMAPGHIADLFNRLYAAIEELEVVAGACRHDWKPSGLSSRQCETCGEVDTL